MVKPWVASRGNAMRRFRAAVAALAVAFLWPPPGLARTAVLHCTNPASGARWNITVDYDHRRVDSFPAEITRDHIRWHDTKHGGFYDLDRARGVLTARFASSTGGSFLSDECRLD
jgi:hypothetical protein